MYWCLLTPTEASHKTGIPTRTIQRWIAEGTLTRYGLRNARQVDYFELSEHLEVIGRPERDDDQPEYLADCA